MQATNNISLGYAKQRCHYCCFLVPFTPLTVLPPVLGWVVDNPDFATAADEADTGATGWEAKTGDDAAAG
jgi:hypothetical protein